MVRAYFAREVVDDCRLADMLDLLGRRGWSKTQQMMRRMGCNERPLERCGRRWDEAVWRRVAVS